MRIRTLFVAQLTALLLGVGLVVVEEPLPQPVTAAHTGDVGDSLPAARVRTPVPRAVTRPGVVAARPAPVPLRRATSPTKPATQHRTLAPPRAKPHPEPHPKPLRATAPALTPRQRLDRAVGRIPGYSAGAARWVLHADDGHWGTADWYRNTVYVSPEVPSHRLYDVVAHEWSHLLSVQAYGGDVDAAVKAMTSWFGGAGFTGADRAADCMAKALGARWTHYTSCADARWREGARRLLARQRLQP